MATPYLLLPYQVRWNRDKSKLKICSKSRRIGITWAEAAESTLIAAQIGRSGQDTWYLAQNEDAAKEFLGDCSFWAKQYNVIASEVEEVILNDEEKDILSYQIRFASGYRVTGLTSKPNNLRGKQGRVVADEFAFHPDPDEVLKAATALLMWGGQIIIISTHNGINNPFNILIQQVLAGKRKASLHEITLDDALEDGLYKRICLVNGETYSKEAEAIWRQELLDAAGDDADEEFFCIPKAASQVYFAGVLIEARMRPDYPVFRLSLPQSFSEKSDQDKRQDISIWLDENIKPVLAALVKQYRSFLGMDFGRTHDCTSIAPIVERPNLKRFTPFMVELRNIPIRQQEQILWFIVDGLPQFVAAAMDARGNGAAIAESTANRYGKSRVEEVMISLNTYRERMPAYKLALEDDVFHIPSDSDIKADHQVVRLEHGVPKVPESARYKGTDGNYRHGDSVIALMLGWSAASKHNIDPANATKQPIAKAAEVNAKKIRALFPTSQTVQMPANRRSAGSIFKP